MADTITLEQVLLDMADCQGNRGVGHTYSRLTSWRLAIAAAIKQREQDANNPLKGWIFDKVNMGRGDERYICTPDGANATTVRNESTSDHRERLLWLIADAMAKESDNE